MPLTFNLFHDSALTQPITSVNPLTATQDGGVLLGAVDKTIYLGSTTSTNKLQVTASPGVNPLIVSIVDAASGTGAPSTEYKLALTSGGLATAVAGASLTLGATINGGVANAVPIFTRRTSAITAPGAYSDISINVATPYESPI